MTDLAAVKVDIPLASRKRLRPNAKIFKSGVHKLAKTDIIVVNSTQPSQSQVGPTDAPLSRIESEGNEEENLDFEERSQQDQQLMSSQKSLIDTNKK